MELNKQIMIIRELETTRGLAWKMWTEPDHLVSWWGPKDFTTPVCKMDVQPGGSIYIEMQSPDGTIYPMSGEYMEVTPPGRLAFTLAALDNKGQKIFEVLNSVELTEENGKTKLSMSAEISHATEDAASHIAGMNEGWNESIDRLEKELSKVNV